ncbi:hypothetical protein ACFXCZ_35045 [Streptomyces sp. NPDC059396]|uniref:hypothetical protein n=1 Tax=Streptomyces sp. NPDC059396 TaxID=3346819 RepID=UPI0036767681
MPELLVDVATRIVVPVTAPPGPDAGEPCEDTFALEALGRVFVTSLRIWTQAGPDAAEGIARAVIDFAAQFLAEDHEARRRCRARFSRDRHLVSPWRRAATPYSVLARNSRSNRTRP